MNVIDLAPGGALPDPLIDTEVYSSVLVRKTAQTGSAPTDINQQSAIITGDARHVVFHDVSDVERWSNATGSLYDVLSYNIGWSAPDRGHGHGLYTQNLENNPVCTVENSVFVIGLADPTGMKWATPAKIYTESEQPRPDGTMQSKCANYIFRRCVFLGASFYVGNINANKLGAVNVVIEDCVFIDCNVFVGYKGPNRDVQFRRNTVINGSVILGGVHENAVIEDNTLIITRPIKYAINMPVTPIGSYTSTGNVIYSDDLTLFEPEWTLGYYRDTAHRDPWGWTDVRPLSACGDRTWHIPIPERNAEWLVVYNPTGRTDLELGDQYRVCDVRRRDAVSIVDRVNLSAADPTPPLNWQAEWGAPPTWAGTLPLVGVFRIEQLTLQEKLDMANAQIDALRAAIAALEAASDQLEDAVETKDAEIAYQASEISDLQAENTALVADIAGRDAQIAALTAERDAALAQAATFRAVLVSVSALVQPHLPPA